MLFKVELIKDAIIDYGTFKTACPITKRLLEIPSFNLDQGSTYLSTYH